MYRRAAFSLFELVIVLFIIGILTAVAMPRYLSHVAQTNDQMTLLKLMQVRDAIDRYQVENDRQLPPATSEATFIATLEKYLRDGFPTVDVGPARGLATVELVTGGGSAAPSTDALAMSADTSAGSGSTDAVATAGDEATISQKAWTYNTETGEFRVNYDGATALDPSTTYDQW